MAIREAARERRQHSIAGRQGSILPQYSQSNVFSEDPMNVGGEPVSTYALPGYDAPNLDFYPSRSMQKMTIEEVEDEDDAKYGPCDVSPSLSMQPNRRTKDGDTQLGTILTLTDAALSRHNTVLRKSNVNHLVH